ncbi:hypothetical protein V8E36_000561 [Tilletia maclaganii]
MRHANTLLAICLLVITTCLVAAPPTSAIPVLFSRSNAVLPLCPGEELASSIVHPRGSSRADHTDFCEDQSIPPTVRARYCLPQHGSHDPHIVEGSEFLASPIAPDFPLAVRSAEPSDDPSLEADYGEVKSSPGPVHHGRAVLDHDDDDDEGGDTVKKARFHFEPLAALSALHFPVKTGAGSTTGPSSPAQPPLPAPPSVPSEKRPFSALAGPPSRFVPSSSLSDALGSIDREHKPIYEHGHGLTTTTTVKARSTNVVQHKGHAKCLPYGGPMFGFDSYGRGPTWWKARSVTARGEPAPSTSSSVTLNAAVRGLKQTLETHHRKGPTQGATTKTIGLPSSSTHRRPSSDRNTWQAPSVFAWGPGNRGPSWPRDNSPNPLLRPSSASFPSETHIGPGKLQGGAAAGGGSGRPETSAATLRLGDDHHHYGSGDGALGHGGGHAPERAALFGWMRPSYGSAPTRGGAWPKEAEAGHGKNGKSDAQ